MAKTLTKEEIRKYVKKIRPLKRECVVALSAVFLEEHNLKAGDFVDIRDFTKVDKESQEMQE